MSLPTTSPEINADKKLNTTTPLTFSKSAKELSAAAATTTAQDISFDNDWTQINFTQEDSAEGYTTSFQAQHSLRNTP